MTPEPVDFEVDTMNRKQRRAMKVATALPATSCKITRWGEKVAIGITEPGFVELTPVEAVQLAEGLLKLAGESSKDEAGEN